MQLSFDSFRAAPAPVAAEKHGVVYTRPWVVDLILDLVGYVDTEDLAARLAVEPAAGDGAFLIPMVRRLVRSCDRFGRSLSEACGSLRAFELDDESARRTRGAVISVLSEADADAELAEELARGWVSTGDYLQLWPRVPSADFVIGNPPYIRLEDVPDVVTTAYRRRYRTMVGRADIYVAFFEAALRHLKPGGVCGFICADRWMLNQYGAELRRFITARYGVEAVIEMHRARAFESDVSAYPAVTIVRKGPQGRALIASTGNSAGEDHGPDLADRLRRLADGVPGARAPAGFRAAHIDSWFTGSDPWPCVSPDRLRLLKQLEARFDPLEQAQTGTRVGIGVATGADEIFVTRDPDVVEPSRLLPLAMAADTRNGQLRWSGHYLVDPWDADGRLVDLREYPRLRDYFEPRRSVLSRRHIAVRRPAGWYRTIDRVHHRLTRQKKLYIPDIKGVLHPVLDTGETYPHHNVYFVQSDVWDHEVLGGLLLSAIAQFFVECYAVRMRGGWLRFQAQYLRRIRVPNPGDIPHDVARELRSAFRDRDIERANVRALPLYGVESLPVGRPDGRR